MNHNTIEKIEIKCPGCGNISYRLKVVLECFAVGCEFCGTMWEHELLKEKEKRMENLN